VLSSGDKCCDRVGPSSHFQGPRDAVPAVHSVGVDFVADCGTARSAPAAGFDLKNVSTSSTSRWTQAMVQLGAAMSPQTTREGMFCYKMHVAWLA